MGLTNSAAKLYGDYAVAAMGAVTRIMTVGTYIVFGFQMVYTSLFLLSGVIWVQPAADLLTTAVTLIFAIKINRTLTAETSAYPQGGELT